jgi:tetratricopeptide (TPR) repeat protein
VLVMSIFRHSFALFVLVCAAQVAHADNYTDCMSGDRKLLITSCTAVIEDPATSDADRAVALDKRSLGLIMAGKLEESLQDIERSLQLEPNSYSALNARAWTVYRMRRTADGMNDVNKSLQLNATNEAAWDTRAHLYQLLGDYEQAFKDYEAAVGFGGDGLIKTYQCGLRERGLYKGPTDGIYSADTRTALRACAFKSNCDPLPENEFQLECEANTS